MRDRHEPQISQRLQRFADGRTSDPKACHQFTLRWQALARRALPVEDHRLQPIEDLVCELASHDHVGVCHCGDFPPFAARDQGRPETLAISIRLKRLASLHRHADFGVRHFSGTATWRTRFTAPPVNGERLFLDLGRVEVIAEVQVNGRSFATLWKPPFRLEVTDALRSGSNELTVRVTNLWPNRLIGDEHFPTPHTYDVTAFNAIGGIAALPDWYREGRPQPKDERVAFTTWRHYDKDDPLLESCLLGPARLFAATLEPFA
jgi:hypothetical protein